MNNPKLNYTNSKVLPCYYCSKPARYFKTKSIVPGNEELVMLYCSNCKHTWVIPKINKQFYLDELVDIKWHWSKRKRDKEDLKFQISFI